MLLRGLTATGISPTLAVRRAWISFAVIHTIGASKDFESKSCIGTTIYNNLSRVVRLPAVTLEPARAHLWRVLFVSKALSGLWALDLP